MAPAKSQYYHCPSTPSLDQPENVYLSCPPNPICRSPSSFYQLLHRSLRWTKYCWYEWNEWGERDVSESPGVWQPESTGERGTGPGFATREYGGPTKRVRNGDGWRLGLGSGLECWVAVTWVGATIIVSECIDAAKAIVLGSVSDEWSKAVLIMIMVVCRVYVDGASYCS